MPDRAQIPDRAGCELQSADAAPIPRQVWCTAYRKPLWRIAGSVRYAVVASSGVWAQLWERASFGTKRPWVRIRHPDHLFCRSERLVAIPLRGFVRFQSAVGPQ